MVERPRSSSRPAAAWLAGVVLGVVGGIGLISFGVLGLAFLAIAALLIAWKGPRLLAAAGLLTGAGLIWTVLFARLQLTCTIGPIPADGGCHTEDLTAWIAGAAAIFVAGLVASALSLRRMQRGG